MKAIVFLILVAIQTFAAAGAEPPITPLDGAGNTLPMETVVPPTAEADASSLAVPTAPLAQRVLIRGWEVKAVSILPRAVVKDIALEYRGKKLTGKSKKVRAAVKGGFVVVLVQCAWATEQPANEPLWKDKPDLTLVDDAGVEYRALGKLVQDSGDLVTLSIAAAPERRGRRPLPAKTSNYLIYFDVSATARTFGLRFPGSASALPIQQVTGLPELPTD